MATSKANKTKNVKNAEPVAIPHPRAERMKRLGTYDLQTPGFHLNTSHDIAVASRKAARVMAKDRATDHTIVPTNEPVEEIVEEVGGMVNSDSGDALKQDEKKSKKSKAKSFKK